MKPKSKMVSGGNRNHLINHLNHFQSDQTAPFHYMQKAPSKQCRNCRSDYMKFAVKGFCQHCQQRVEFIVREHPHIAAQAQKQEEDYAG
jgi:hypothetical protein